MDHNFAVLNLDCLISFLLLHELSWLIFLFFLRFAGEGRILLTVNILQIIGQLLLELLLSSKRFLQYFVHLLALLDIPDQLLPFLYLFHLELSNCRFNALLFRFLFGSFLLLAVRFVV